jgi:hypothetical protein
MIKIEDEGNRACNASLLLQIFYISIQFSRDFHGRDKNQKCRANNRSEFNAQ